MIYLLRIISWLYVFLAIAVFVLMIYGAYVVYELLRGEDGE